MLLKKIILVCFLCFLWSEISFATQAVEISLENKNSYTTSEFFDRRLFDFTPQEIEEINRARKQKEQQELIINILIVVVILALIIVAVAKLKKSRRYQFAKDYAYMLKLIDIAKSQNTSEHSIAVLCKGEKSVSVVNEIYAFCITHENLNEVVRRHNATLSDFQKIYEGLTMFCCVDSGDKFIPVSAFLKIFGRDKNV